MKARPWFAGFIGTAVAAVLAFGAPVAVDAAHAETVHAHAVRPGPTSRVGGAVSVHRSGGHVVHILGHHHRHHHKHRR